MSEWISVGEWLPESNIDVMVYTNQGYRVTAFVDIDKGEWFMPIPRMLGDQKIEQLYDVTHWTLLPKMPEEK